MKRRPAEWRTAWGPFESDDLKSHGSIKLSCSQQRWWCYWPREQGPLTLMSKKPDQRLRELLSHTNATFDHVYLDGQHYERSLCPLSPTHFIRHALALCLLSIPLMAKRTFNVKKEKEGGGFAAVSKIGPNRVFSFSARSKRSRVTRQEQDVEQEMEGN